jgi:hypothetical protein
MGFVSDSSDSCFACLLVHVISQGSSAALRGSSSSSTADAISKFLVEVASEGSAALPCLSNSPKVALDIKSFFDNELQRLSVQISSAAAYGSILMEDDIKPLIKQRLTHASLKYIKKTFDKERSQAQSGEQISAPPVGLLLIVCHLICASDLSKTDRSTVHMVATLASEGLSSDLFQVGIKLPEEGSEARMLVICAVLKLVCTSPKTVNGFVLTLVSGLLRAYAVSDPDSEIGTKLIILQAMEEVSHLDGAKATILAVKPAVLAILASAMNQRSGVLRSAAVDVRNAWCIVD